MSRLTLSAAALAALWPIVIPRAAQAQEQIGGVPAQFVEQTQARPIHHAEMTSGMAYHPQMLPWDPYCQQPDIYRTYSTGRYPVLGAPLYPSPQPNVPVQTGITTITNHAFAPHEMLYPHKYRALYPPFYYRVKGGWIWTPFGMHSSDNWQLKGTMVKINYKSKIGLLSSFAPPAIR